MWEVWPLNGHIILLSLLQVFDLLFLPLLLITVFLLFFKIVVFGEQSLQSDALIFFGWMLEVLHVEAAGGAV